MFNQFSDQMKKSTQPVSDLFAANAKALQTVSEQQAALLSGVLNDSVKLIQAASQQTEMNGLLAAQSMFAESVRERLTSTSRSNYSTLNEVSQQLAQAMQTTIDTSPNAEKAPVKAPAAKKTVAKKASVKAPVKKAAVKKPTPAAAKPAAKAKEEAVAAKPAVAKKPAVKKAAPAKKAAPKKAAPKKSVPTLSADNVKATPKTAAKATAKKTAENTAPAKVAPSDVTASAPKTK